MRSTLWHFYCGIRLILSKTVKHETVADLQKLQQPFQDFSIAVRQLALQSPRKNAGINLGALSHVISCTNKTSMASTLRFQQVASILRCLTVRLDHVRSADKSYIPSLTLSHWPADSWPQMHQAVSSPCRPWRPGDGLKPRPGGFGHGPLGFKRCTSLDSKMPGWNSMPWRRNDTSTHWWENHVAAHLFHQSVELTGVWPQDFELSVLSHLPNDLGIELKSDPALKLFNRVLHNRRHWQRE